MPLPPLRPVSSSRRRFLKLVGRAGGTAAVLTTMKEMGLLASADAVEKPQLRAQQGNGIRVVILGAGLAGMTAAYELRKAGYDCQILEARDRAGGRCQTIRGGDVVVETESSQTCSFDEGLYFNPGPARIPYHHTAVLGYCKEFGVPLEVIVNENRATYFQDDKAFGGQPILNRRVVNDSRGYISELLAKAISQNSLDQEVSDLDQERLMSFVKSFGSLGDDYRYTGSSRGGYITGPGAGTAVGESFEPLGLAPLLSSDFWDYKLHFGEGYTQAATMLKPVGGMDKIAQAFESQVSDLIEYSAPVSQIRKTPEGVSIIYSSGDGTEKELAADYAICTFPLSVLAKIDADFSPAVQAAIEEGGSSYANAIKVAFQANRRFWEEDYNIYGGISWTEKDITQIWYPSSGFQSNHGIIVGAYIWDNPIGNAWGLLSPAERMAKAIEEGSAIHPNYAEEVSAAQGISIAWEKVPFSDGGWAEWEDEQREAAYRILLQPDDSIFLAGEHLSYLTGWQEGAVQSALLAVKGVADRVAQTADG
ncbi:amine oxidase, flavin-containing superfamily [Synechococcus sp. PCC 7335]|uniref:flavin monoamine oxidase family protein n=1 Tax=Synechococcus sp. (strain ATCC 29403 / PCC 7335) TaxID=91464 RepID=UPI00017EE78E|nr:flavin monoamine oxidase family protein [Synechococcus sp. PCC 7335]EDX85966.1 amine oxidase, flavin-containing superfamily [Synechococcus sp. PCC 7335]